MGTINDYINSETDTLTAENYNELDAAVFAQLTYFKFENGGYAGDDDVEMSVDEYAELLLENPDIYSADKEGYSADEKALLESLRDSERYSNCTLSNFEDPSSMQVNGENLDSQWAAYTVNINDGSDTSVVAMRGTDGTTLGWKEDFELAYDEDGTNAQILSAEYYKDVDASNIYSTGHSKGGNDVISGYIMSDDDVRDRVLRIDNFDGPGVNSAYQKNYADGYNELDGKLNNYYPENSVIGRLLIDKPGNTSFVGAEVRPDYEDMSILGEHDLFAFLVGDGDSFKEAEPSYLSNLLNESIDKTVSELSISERENLVNMLDKLGVYSIIAGDGQDPYSDNLEGIEKWLDEVDKWGILPEDLKNNIAENLEGTVSLYEGIKQFMDSSDAEKAAVIDTIGIFLECAASKAVNDLKDKVVDTYNDVKDAVVDTYNDVKDAVVDTYNDVKDAVVDTYNDVKDAVVDTYNKAKDEIKEKMEKFYDDISDKLSQYRDNIAGQINKLKKSIADKMDSLGQSVGSYLQNTWQDVLNTLSNINGLGGSGRSDFYINLTSIQSAIQELRQASSKIDNIIARVNSVVSNLSRLSFGMSMVGLQTILSNLNKHKKSCEKMAETLEQILKLYRNAERRIAAQTN